MPRFDVKTPSTTNVGLRRPAGLRPDPKLQQQIREADLILAVGPRLGEATTDGYTLITPDHPGQTLVHVHPDPNELGRVYHADLPICADMGEFAEMLDEWSDPDLVRFSAGEKAHRWLEWSEPSPRKGVKLDLGPCVKAMRDRLPENTIVCNGAGNFSGWWHRYWRYGPMPTQLAPTSGTMGYGLPAAVAAAIRFRDRPVVAVAGDGDFLMNGEELATAAQYAADLLVILVDNGSYGTIRMHQERDYPKRISGTELKNPDFAALARAYGGWAETVERTEDFAPALGKALKRKGIRLIHCKTDVEQITNATTIKKLREKAKAPSARGGRSPRAATPARTAKRGYRVSPGARALRFRLIAQDPCGVRREIPDHLVKVPAEAAFFDRPSVRHGLLRRNNGRSFGFASVIHSRSGRGFSQAVTVKHPSPPRRSTGRSAPRRGTLGAGSRPLAWSP